MGLAINITNRGKDVYLAFEGVLDENCHLPEFSEPIIGCLRINLERLQMINSLGCRRWVQWIPSNAQAKGGVILEMCSPAAVHQMNVLEGFLPPHVQVDSFFVPYYCESCGHEDQILLTRGHEYNDAGTLRYSEELPCPKCKSMMNMEVVRERYFKFLSRRKAA